MASIQSSSILYDRAQADGTRDVKYRYTALSNNATTLDVDYGPLRGVAADFDADADILARAPNILLNLAEEDKTYHATNAAEDILWNDQGGFFTKAVPDWTTWNEAATAVLVYWLQQVDKLDLVNLAPFLSHVSNTDLKNLLSITNQQVSDIRGDVQIAIDTKAVLDTYSPWADQDGVIRE